MKKVLLATLLLALTASVSTAHAYDLAWRRAHWGEGHWVHDRHGGQLGWWWVVGGVWHFFPHPVAQPQMMIIQQPAPVVIAQPAPVMVAPAAPAPVVVAQQPVTPAPAPAAVTPTMYYCKATGTYYPETMTCPNGWTPITAGAPPAP